MVAVAACHDGQITQPLFTSLKIRGQTLFFNDVESTNKKTE